MSAPSAPAADRWFDAWRWGRALGWECLETLWGLRRPEQLRARLLAEARRTAAEVLRSPAFLELMRVNMGAMTLSGRLMSPFRIQQEKSQ
ncbi:MAG TPA: hypothetical protein VHO06_26165 [Polyangia bacterium]|nr:hypothetical protein [Polyangia bacterium]